MTTESDGPNDQSCFAVQTRRFGKWRKFQEFVTATFADECHYVFRGQRCDRWLLEPTITRLFRSHPHLACLDPKQKGEWMERHYYEFQYAIRGRRGMHPPEIVGDYLWALGQHFGLATPLLDWTMSPYVAAFFAFSETRAPQTKYRAIFALDKPQIEERSEELSRSGDLKERVYFLSPMSDENPRLVNQGGLFSRLPTDINLEEWIRNHADRRWTRPTLFKLLVPDSERAIVLRALARMNINHLSVFPDLVGASLFCNLALTQPEYALHLGRPRPQRVRIGR